MFGRAERLILGLALLAAIGGGLLQRHGQHATRSPAALVGKTLPDLALADLQGKTHRLTAWQGRPLLLNFWATWCGPCREEMPALNRLAHNVGENAPRVVGIAMDDPDRVRSFLAVHPVDYPVLLGQMTAPDTSELAGDTGGLLPYSVLLGADGRVLAAHAGMLPEGWVTQHAQATSPPSR